MVDETFPSFQTLSSSIPSAIRPTMIPTWYREIRCSNLDFGVRLLKQLISNLDIIKRALIGLL